MALTGTLGTFTPYSTVTPLIDWDPTWAPTFERERIASYQKYEELYWNNPTAFKLQQRGGESNPIYVPNPRVIVDSTSHFLFKGFKLTAPEGAQQERNQSLLDKFLKYVDFYNMFHTAKHSGVVRGDYIFHMMADPKLPAGKKILIESIDPGSYFPIYDEDHPDEILGVDLVDVFLDTNGSSKVLRQRYLYVWVQGRRRVESSLMLVEVDKWWDNKEARIIKTIIEPKLLPEGITTIPLYLFKNIDWQGQPYGSSELRGFERLFGSVNQSAEDEEIALALEGLGVYATDAPHPTNTQGQQVPWNISPGRVIEMPANSTFERVSGVGSIKPMQDHIGYLEHSLFEASGTFRPANIDVQVAQSGIALAIKFLPTLAKSEERETNGEGILQQMFLDWAAWEMAYENQTFGDVEFEVNVALGEKLPEDPAQTINELNNMLDRGVISRDYYRTVMTEKFGYTFPDNIEEELLKEMATRLELQQQFTPVQANGSGGPSDQSGTANKDKGKQNNQSNNKGRPNESAGTEAK